VKCQTHAFESISHQNIFAFIQKCTVSYHVVVSILVSQHLIKQLGSVFLCAGVAPRVQEIILSIFLVLTCIKSALKKGSGSCSADWAYVTVHRTSMNVTLHEKEHSPVRAMKLCFPTLSHNGTIFGKKFIESKECVLILSIYFVWNVFHSKKNSARYYRKCT
jgi:hypothetical protein